MCLVVLTILVLTSLKYWPFYSPLPFHSIFVDGSAASLSEIDNVDLTTLALVLFKMYSWRVLNKLGHPSQLREVLLGIEMIHDLRVLLKPRMSWVALSLFLLADKMTQDQAHFQELYLIYENWIYHSIAWFVRIPNRWENGYKNSRVKVFYCGRKVLGRKICDLKFYYSIN